MTGRLHNIRAHQRRLADLGHYAGAVDGDWGPLTDGALVSFKRVHGMQARVYHTATTLALLFSDRAKPLPKAVATAIGSASMLPWMREAMETKGLHEDRDNASLRRHLADGKHPVDPASTAWCGAYVSDAFAVGLPDEPQDFNVLGARQWGRFGIDLPLDDAAYGAVAVFWRGTRDGWMGHVTLVVGVIRDATGRVTHLDCLGGNQNNAVKVSRYRVSGPGNRFLTLRWPSTFPLPGTRLTGTAWDAVPTDGDEA